MKFSKQNIIAASTVVLIGIGGVATIATAHDDGHRSGYFEDHGDRHHGKHRRGGKKLKMMMERFDTNKDGSLTQEEIDTTRAALITTFDADSNGQLTLQEFKSLWMEVNNRDAVRGFQRLDTDGDAIVTTEEFNAPFANIVEKFDRNGDGALSKEDRRGRRGKKAKRGNNSDSQ